MKFTTRQEVSVVFTKMADFEETDIFPNPTDEPENSNSQFPEDDLTGENVRNFTIF